MMDSNPISLTIKPSWTSTKELHFWMTKALGIYTLSIIIVVNLK